MNRAGDALRRMGPGGRRWLTRKWDEQRAFLRGNPPIDTGYAERAALVERLEAARDLAAAYPWANRTADIDHDVMLALLGVGIDARTDQPSRSWRSLAEMVGVDHHTVGESLSRLAGYGLVSTIHDNDRQQADRHRLLLTELESAVPAPNKPSPLRGANGFLIGQESTTIQDLFSNGPGGLGHAAWHTWLATQDDYWLTTAEIRQRRHPVGGASTRDHLRRLAESGLAERRGHRWRQLVPSEDCLQLLAQQHGVAGRTDRRVARIKAERSNFQNPAAFVDQGSLPAEWGLDEGRDPGCTHAASESPTAPPASMSSGQAERVGRPEWGPTVVGCEVGA